MKNIFLCVISFLSVSLGALEYEVQFENDQVHVSRVKIMPHEEIGLHKDEYSQVVIALQGGTITRLEADGTKNDVAFPTHQAVFREAEKTDQLHRSVNNSSTPVELMIVQLKNSNTTN